ncbi:MAG: signal recognition particle-docking protein FtsY [Alphaproteobacteria bacterium]|nr:signal recognition particle-docking protein FtsY [Alphaproteobacteria bacterium]
MTDTPASWFGRLKAGLSRSAGALSQGLAGVFGKAQVDAATLHDLEELLIASDLGVQASARIAAKLGEKRWSAQVPAGEARIAVADAIAAVLQPVELPLDVTTHKPFVVLVVGVNGTGKTTTIGKLATRYRAEGRSVSLVAGDTFRAAAIEQLKAWGTRAGVPVIAREAGSDASGLVFDALTQAKAAGTEVLLVDTAGRLQNKADLMAELAKIVRVLKKVDAGAPHAVLLVLDATTGQNARSQVAAFRDLVQVSGLIMAKLDGTARGGMLIALAEEFGLPIHFVGVGEKAEDLQPFNAQAFARALVGLDA